MTAPGVQPGSGAPSAATIAPQPTPELLSLLDVGGSGNLLDFEALTGPGFLDLEGLDDLLEADELALLEGDQGAQPSAPVALQQPSGFLACFGACFAPPATVVTTGGSSPGTAPEFTQAPGHGGANPSTSGGSGSNGRSTAKDKKGPPRKRTAEQLEHNRIQQQKYRQRKKLEQTQMMSAFTQLATQLTTGKALEATATLQQQQQQALVGSAATLSPPFTPYQHACAPLPTQLHNGSTLGAVEPGIWAQSPPGQLVPAPVAPQWLPGGAADPSQADQATLHATLAAAQAQIASQQAQLASQAQQLAEAQRRLDEQTQLVASQQRLIFDQQTRLQMQVQVVEQLKDRLRDAIDATLATPHNELCEQLMRAVRASLATAPSFGAVRQLMAQFDKLSDEAAHDLVRSIYQTCRDTYPALFPNCALLGTSPAEGAGSGGAAGADAASAVGVLAAAHAAGAPVPMVQ